MDTTYSKAVALAVPVFLALIALEFTVDRVKRTRYYQDRKSTRLNSSHLVISYAVFCLKNDSGPPVSTVYSALRGVACIIGGLCTAVGDFTDFFVDQQPFAQRWNCTQWTLESP